MKDHRDRRVPVKAVEARRRLSRVQDRCEAHVASVQAQGRFLTSRSVLVLLEDVLAVARGEMQ